MSIAFEIDADLGRPMPAARHYAMQGDKGLRSFQVTPKYNGVTWSPPEGYRVEVRYTKSDGTGGSYDTLPDGSPALISAALGVYSIGTVPQLFTAPGAVKVSIVFIAGEKEIATFPVVIEVTRCPGIDVRSEDYVKLSPYVKNAGWTGGKLLGTDEAGKVVEVEGSAGADGPAVTAISVTEGEDGTVTMVNTLDNGETETIVVIPDASGNPASLTYNGTEIPITWTEAVT